MGRKKLGKLRLNITLSPEVVAGLDAAAAERRVDRSNLIEELARDYLRKREPARGRKRT